MTLIEDHKLDTSDTPKPHPGRKLTEADFVRWVDRYTRAEWLNGEIYIMSPVTFEHDQIQLWLMRLFCDFVESRNLGRVCGSEYLVRLPTQRARHLTDLFFVAKSAPESNFQPTCYNGAPDLIVEIVSFDSISRDYRLKFNNYQAAGVKEYWIIDPLNQQVEAHTLIRKIFQPIPLEKDSFHSKVLKGLWIKPDWLWKKKLPTVPSVLKQF